MTAGGTGTTPARRIAARAGAVLILAVVAATAFGPLPAQAQAGSVESELLALVNAGRRNVGRAALTAHGGLRAQAAVHSHDMSAAGGINHNGAAARIVQAAPDPAETHGAPDDGFTSRWCENVAYVRVDDPSQVAGMLYEVWFNSPSHRACMLDSIGRGVNVAGLAVHRDSADRWWATLELAADRSLPGTSARLPDAPASSGATQQPEARPPAQAAPQPAAVQEVVAERVVLQVLASKAAVVELSTPDLVASRPVAVSRVATDGAVAGATAGALSVVTLLGAFALRRHRRRALWPAGCEKPPGVYVPGRMRRPQHAWSAWSPARANG